LADSLFLVGLHQTLQVILKKTVSAVAPGVAQEYIIMNSKPEDFARSRAEVFPIANEAGGGESSA
jgi:hypothetical protein